MKKSLILTVVAPDRTGLVGELSAIIAKHGANWIDSSMVRLGGHFAGVLRISIDAEDLKQLRLALLRLEDKGFTISLYEEGKQQSLPEGAQAQISILGQDQPGMLSRISGILAYHHVSINELTSCVEPGSMSGELMFKATATIILPIKLSAEQLISDLEKIAGDIMIELDYLQ
ncbi:glycine cleavage system protein R [Flexibacterium corallicola]|uniref:glycine cleavage system protein R n=1 Tax=Flexibacterium corallicola TaxID=3037259 RepID=UPI00286F3FDC|nr:ACT domain-containing protein [Pseudovibrio sp. M1P-2-3]